MGLSTEQVQQLANFVRRSNRSRGCRHGAAAVRRGGRGRAKVGEEYVVMLNDEQIPHLRISDTSRN